MKNHEMHVISMLGSRRILKIVRVVDSVELTQANHCYECWKNRKATKDPRCTNGKNVFVPRRNRCPETSGTSSSRRWRSSSRRSRAAKTRNSRGRSRSTRSSRGSTTRCRTTSRARIFSSNSSEPAARRCAAAPRGSPVLTINKRNWRIGKGNNTREDKWKPLKGLSKKSHDKKRNPKTKKQKQRNQNKTKKRNKAWLKPFFYRTASETKSTATIERVWTIAAGVTDVPRERARYP